MPGTALQTYRRRHQPVFSLAGSSVLIEASTTCRSHAAAFEKGVQELEDGTLVGGWERLDFLDSF